MKNKSPLIGLFTNTGWKDEMIIRIPICEKKNAKIVQLSSTPIYLSK